MNKNIELNLNELERLALSGGSDGDNIEGTRSAIISTVTATIGAISAVTSVLSCNRTCTCK